MTLTIQDIRDDVDRATLNTLEELGNSVETSPLQQAIDSFVSNQKGLNLLMKAASTDELTHFTGEDIGKGSPYSLKMRVAEMRQKWNQIMHIGNILSPIRRLSNLSDETSEKARQWIKDMQKQGAKVELLEDVGRQSLTELNNILPDNIENVSDEAASQAKMNIAVVTAILVGYKQVNDLDVQKTAVKQKMRLFVGRRVESSTHWFDMGTDQDLIDTLTEEDLDDILDDLTTNYNGQSPLLTELREIEAMI